MSRRDAGLEDRRPKKEMRDVHCTLYSVQYERRDWGKERCEKERIRKG